MFGLDTGKLIVSEFKYYIYACWVVLLDNKTDATGTAGVELPFPPPPLIGSVHDLLMTYTQNYKKFCQDVFGTIAYRNRDYTQNGFLSYQNHWNSIDVIRRSDYLVCGHKHGYPNVWPFFQNYQQFVY